MMHLNDWLKKTGAKGTEDLELADFASTGRGVRAKRPFKQGEKILTIGGDSLWTVQRAHNDELVGSILKSASLSVEDTLALYLLFVRSRESGYEGLKSHVSVLPTSYTSSIFFSDDELEVCAGSSLYAVTKQVLQQLEESYRDIVQRIIAPNRDLFSLEKFSFDDYKWATCTIWSRCMDFALSKDSPTRVLPPFADMLNHSPDVQQCHAYDPSSGNLIVYAGKDYKVGDQVFITYGRVPNNRLLRLYGFVIPDNPYDSYDLVLSTNPAAPFFEQKERLWASAGLETTSTLGLTLSDPLPNEVLRYLRIQRCDESDLAAAVMQQIEGDRGKISDTNETQVLESLIESFTSLLAGFGTSLEKLEKQVAGEFTSGSKAWSAAQVGLGEQRILRAAKTRAQNMLAALKGGGSTGAGCANCYTTSGKLMICSRCKTVQYCSRPCQVAHFKSHKSACQAAAK